MKHFSLICKYCTVLLFEINSFKTIFVFFFNTYFNLGFIDCDLYTFSQMRYCFDVLKKFCVTILQKNIIMFKFYDMLFVEVS